jgi:glucose/mannose-6-phosphate isomerase
MLKALKSVIHLDSYIIDTSLSKIESLGHLIGSSNFSETNDALSLANWISQVPVTYYPGGLKSAAIRFKNSLQENSKMHAITEEVVEASHNGIVSWESPSNFQPIFLRGKDDYFKTIELWEILKEYFTEKKIDFYEIMSPEGHILTKLVYLIYLLDYTTIYLSALRGVDPSPVKSIDFIKSKITN